MIAPGTIEQLRDPDLDLLLDGIRATYIPLFENQKSFSYNIAPVCRSTEPPRSDRFIDKFRQKKQHRLSAPEKFLDKLGKKHPHKFQNTMKAREKDIDLFEDLRGNSRIFDFFRQFSTIILYPRVKEDYMKQIGNGFKEYYYLTEEG